MWLLGTSVGVMSVVVVVEGVSMGFFGLSGNMILSLDLGLALRDKGATLREGSLVNGSDWGETASLEIAVPLSFCHSSTEDKEEEEEEEET